MKFWVGNNQDQKGSIFCVCAHAGCMADSIGMVETGGESLFLRNKVIISNNNYNNNIIIIIVQKIARQMSSNILFFTNLVLQLYYKILYKGGVHV